MAAIVPKSRNRKSVPRPATAKRRVNVSVRADFIEQARAAQLNLSQVLEESLAGHLKIAREQRWLEENREAIAEYNDYIGKYGLLSDAYRRF